MTDPFRDRFLLYFVGLPLALAACLGILWAAKAVLVPILFAILIAQLLSPLVNRLERILPLVMASAIAMAVLGAAIAAIVSLFVNQLGALESAMPAIHEHLGDAIDRGLATIDSAFAFPFASKNIVLQNAAESSVMSGGLAALSAFKFTVSMAVESILVGVMAFLMLLYRHHFRSHLKRLGEKSQVAAIVRAIDCTVELGQSYIVGVGSVVVGVTIADAVGLALVGVPFALLFGAAGGFAVLLPYVGIAIAAPACAILAWTITGSSASAFAALGVFAVVHLIEGQVISPLVMGSKVKLNPLATIICVIAGGEIWGPAGMLLFIPIGGLLKIALESQPPTEPLGRLLGPMAADGGRRRIRRRERLSAPSVENTRPLPTVRGDESPVFDQ